MRKRISTSEPALTTGTITAIVTAAVVFAVAFGLDLSERQVAATTGLAAVLAPLISGYFTRGQVTPVAEVAVQVAPDGQLVAADGVSALPNGTVVDVAPAAQAPVAPPLEE